MSGRIPRCCDNSAHAVLDLDENGDLLDPDTGKPVTPRAVETFLASRLRIPEAATDVVVFAHGWQNSPRKAVASGHQLFAAADHVHRAAPDRYSAIGPWSGYYVTVRWPSTSNPFLTGYRRIRDRAHRMTTHGRAAEVLSHLLGYLNAQRRPPGTPPTLRTAGGQYLHCVGHSFGGRFLAEAVQAAADSRPTVLGWNRANPRYPYTVDTLLVFQMAAPVDVFHQRFRRLLGDAPINGPLVLTHSTSDRAVGTWHTMAEGAPGIGHAGASGPDGQVGAIRLHEVDEPYQRADFATALVNVDASWRYRKGRRWRPAGAHSDIWYPESAHLLLSLAALAR